LSSRNNKAARNKLDKLERALHKKLLAFYNSKIKGLPIPVDILKQKYNQQVQEIIRKTAQDSYIAGTEQVGDQVLNKDQSFQLFISTTDLNNIQALTSRLSNDFWDTARRLQDRESAVTPEGKPKPSLDHIAALSAIAAGVAFSAFNNAVLSKSSQVTSIPPPVPPPGLPLDPFALENLGLGLDTTTDFTTERTGRVRFVTQNDAKVDPDICAPLHGMEWFVDDPSIITPPDDTHPNCRCTLEPVIE